MSADKRPHCPTCHRRLHPQRALEKARPCLLCGLPVESTGLGRPRQLHPECRKARAALLDEARLARRKVQP